MTENEFLLYDRLQKIKSIINKYGEDNFYQSYSGGKDSVVLSSLLDMACPGNKIPRVYANTGIEYNMIIDFVKKEQSKDHTWDLIILKPKTPIKPMLDHEGYPFKSKFHSRAVWEYQTGRKNNVLCTEYRNRTSIWNSRKCPNKLLYQFNNDWNDIKISDKCCDRLKKEPLHNYMKESGRKIAIIGIMPAEGGRREKAKCIVFSGKNIKAFQPLVPVDKAWEDWFIKAYNIDICDIYKPPYNFERTGCKGYPFALHLQKELDTLEKYFPGERKQCELIWKPVYEEYRRLGYRLRKTGEGQQLTIDDFNA